MKLWRITPSMKKTSTETQRWTKEGESGYVIREITWRWVEFVFQTEDSVVPTFDENVDMFNSGYNLIRSGFLHETSAKTMYFDSENEMLREETSPPENSPITLENGGWIMSNPQVYIGGEIIVEMIEE
jgi:hypothetical protein